MTTLEVQLNKVRLIVLASLFFFSILLAVYLCYYLFLDQMYSLKLLIVLCIAVPILIFIIWFTIKKVGSDKPALIVDNKGILDTINFSDVGVIPWTNIAQATIVNQQNSYFIIIKLKNPENVIQRLDGIKLKLAKNNLTNFGTPFIINVSNLKMDKFELLEIFKTEIQRWQT